VGALNRPVLGIVNNAMDGTEDGGECHRAQADNEDEKGRRSLNHSCHEVLLPQVVMTATTRSQSAQSFAGLARTDLICVRAHTAVSLLAAQPAIFVRREIFQQAGGAREDCSAKRSEAGACL
jgi:hypothetical protein